MNHDSLNKTNTKHLERDLPTLPSVPADVALSQREHGPTEEPTRRGSIHFRFERWAKFWARYSQKEMELWREHVPSAFTSAHEFLPGTKEYELAPKVLNVVGKFHYERDVVLDEEDAALLLNFLEGIDPENEVVCWRLTPESARRSLEDFDVALEEVRAIRESLDEGS